MAQNSFYILIGHGHPLTGGLLQNVPRNGTMIKMIPGTCTPAERAIKLAELLIIPLSSPTSTRTTPAELVQHLNEMKSDVNLPAFNIYEPSSQYSESRIVIRDTHLYHYKFDDTTKQMSKHDLTDLLLDAINPPGHIPLSSVNRYLAVNSTNYTLLVLACMQVDPKTDAEVQKHLLAGMSVDDVHTKLKRMGYYGGNKSRMTKKSMRKKRRNRKTTQLKKKRATKRR